MVHHMDVREVVESSEGELSIEYEQCYPQHTDADKSRRRKALDITDAARLLWTNGEVRSPARPL